MIAEKNFTPRLGRTLDKNTLVGVHWNAHKNCWSIVAMKSRKTVGLVLGYCQEITLRDVTAHIDKSKQKKVLESPTQAKDRHAFMVGYIEELGYTELEKNIYYKPQAVKSFVDAETWFTKGEASYIEHVKSVSMKWNWEKNHPVVKYSA